MEARERGHTRESTIARTRTRGSHTRSSTQPVADQTCRSKNFNTQCRIFSQTFNATDDGDEVSRSRLLVFLHTCPKDPSVSRNLGALKRAVLDVPWASGFHDRRLHFLGQCLLEVPLQLNDPPLALPNVGRQLHQRFGLRKKHRINRAPMGLAGVTSMYSFVNFCHARNPLMSLTPCSVKRASPVKSTQNTSQLGAPALDMHLVLELLDRSLPRNIAQLGLDSTHDLDLAVPDVIRGRPCCHRAQPGSELSLSGSADDSEG